MSSNAAIFATTGDFILSVFFKFSQGFVNLEFLYSSAFATLVEQKDKTMAYEIQFIDRMGFVFLIYILLMVVMSLIDNKKGVVVKALKVDTKMFKVNNDLLNIV